MLANIVPLQTPLTPGWGQKVIFFLSASSHVAYQIKGSETFYTMQANILHFYTPLTPWWGQNIFFEEGHVAYQITRKEVQNIMQVKCTPLTFWVG